MTKQIAKKDNVLIQQNQTFSLTRNGGELWCSSEIKKKKQNNNPKWNSYNVLWHSVLPSWADITITNKTKSNRICQIRLADVHSSLS